MALIIPPGYGLASIVFTSSVGTGPFVTTIGLDLRDAGGQFVLAANKTKSQYGTAFAALTDNRMVLDRVSILVGQDGEAGSVDSNSPPTPMTRSGDAGPVAMAVIARKVTNRLGRSGRGRMFLPGTCTEAGVDADGGLTTAFRTAHATALTAFRTGMEGASDFPIPLVLLHGPTGPVTPTPIVGLTPSDLVGWVRGRIR